MSTRAQWQTLLLGILVGALLFLSTLSASARIGFSRAGDAQSVGADRGALLSDSGAGTTVFLPIARNGRRVPTTIHLTEIATAKRTTDLQHAGDARLFIVEQGGRIRIYEGGQVRATPFLDISGQVESGGERGLLGLAFHPEYATNGYFFVNYTTSVSGSLQTRVSRFSVDGRNGNLADADSEQVLLAFEQPYRNHNGGAIHFGPDGYLYVAVGDGGDSNDPEGVAQDAGSILGKLLRLDVDSDGSGNPPDCDQSGNSHYQIPMGNPLADGSGGACDEIWALGLRNPWRFSFDSTTGDLWIGDVGQGAWEEVDFEPAGSAGGRNYGWDCYEGNHANDPYAAPTCSGDRADYVFPVHEYAHDNDRCSITGGYVYRGSAYEALQGHYLFADFCSGEMWSLSGPPLSPILTTITTTGASLSHLTTFGQDVNGELYVGTGSGVYRLEE